MKSEEVVLLAKLFERRMRKMQHQLRNLEISQRIVNFQSEAAYVVNHESS